MLWTEALKAMLATTCLRRGYMSIQCEGMGVYHTFFEQCVIVCGMGENWAVGRREALFSALHGPRMWMSEDPDT